MNILFVNYGDFTTNSLNHIAGFANALTARGHDCVVAVPGGRDTFSVITRPRFTPATHAELLARPAFFRDRRAADLIHAWTPREVVRRFVLAYQPQARARLVVHLEDNEEFLIEAWAGQPAGELRTHSDAELAVTLQDGLSHPLRYRNLLRLADGVTVIIDSLRRFVPPGPPVHALPPGLDFASYRPQAADPARRREFGLRAEEKVIVFPGSVTFANQDEIRDLYQAVRMLNERGIPTRLFRAGFTLPDFEASLGFDPRSCVLELGFVKNADVPGLLALADVLVQPGRANAFNDYRLPSKLPEFLALGKPVVLPATNLAAQMENGREALFLSTGAPAEIADACQRIFSDADLAARLGAGAVAFAQKHFDLAANADGLAEFYARIAAAPPRSDWTAALPSPAADVPLLARQLQEELAKQPAAPAPDQRRSLAELAEDVALLCRQLAEDAGASPARAVVARLEQERDELREAMAATRQHVSNLELTRSKLEHELTQTHYQLAESRSRAMALGEHSLRELTRLRDLLRETIRQKDDRLFQREEKIRQMQASWSWRLTAPLRALRRALIDPLGKKPAAPVAQARAYDFSAVPEVQLAFRPADFQPLFSDFRSSVDYPTTWSFQPRTLILRGWCLSVVNRPIKGVRATIGKRVYPGLYGLKRMDVLASLKEHAQAEYCGFKIEVDFRSGDAELVLEIADEAGAWQRFFVTSLGIDENLSLPELSSYEAWIGLYDRHTPESLQALAVNVARFARRPVISVVMPVYNTPETWLVRAIDSVRAQVYPHWELCLADDASPAAHVRPLLERYAAADPRIKVTFRGQNGHISAASNSALALATGEWIALLDHDDELAPQALYEVAALLNAHPETDLLYSDEDKIDAEGRRHEPYFKPDFLPDLFTGQNFISHLAVYRASLIREIGGFRVGFEGSQDWDLALRFIERIAPERIRHLPKVLYHWRAIEGSTALLLSEKNYHAEAARKALGEHFARIGETVELLPVPGDHWRVKRPLPSSPPLVSLLIPTRNGLSLLRRCLDSIREKTTYPNYEIVIVDNDSDDPAMREYLAALTAAGKQECRSTPAGGLSSSRSVHVLSYPHPFNYSAINNFAVREARGEIVGLLNNDLEVINGDWLDEMVSQAMRPGIGAVGAMLYYPNEVIQHAGVILGLGGVAGHAFRDFSRGSEGRFNRARLVQNYSAVTAACLVIRKAIYEQVGGFDETQLAVAFNDIDFCLKVRVAGYRNLWTPFAEFYHHESASRGADDTPQKEDRFRREVETMLSRWGDVLRDDPAYNPNLTLELNDFSLANPPRPWAP